MPPKEYRVRTLFPYEGQRPEDLGRCCPLSPKVLLTRWCVAFPENVILSAHPSKSGGDWWYGTPVRDNKSGFFPQAYVERVETGTNLLMLNLYHLMTLVAVKATALYPYTGNNPDELPFAEGDTLAVIDRSDTDWWKVEQDGLVFIVPAGYVALVEGQ